MSEPLPPWLANLDPRLVRPDWKKWVRPDWQTWMPPDPGPSMRERLWRSYREEQPPPRRATALTEADILFFRSNLSALRFRASPNFDSLSPRDYLRDKDWNERRRVGLYALIKYGAMKP